MDALMQATGLAPMEALCITLSVQWWEMDDKFCLAG